MYETKLPEIQVRVLKAQWTEASSYQSVSSWLRLRTSHETRIDVVSGQDDSMALGARKAFQEISNQTERERWLSLPFTGCDGLPETGQAWVRSGLLAATVVVPANTGQALDMLVRAAHTSAVPPEHTLTTPSSYPELKQIAGRKTEKSRNAFV
jgi:ribose transport system substrate-binding protein